METRVIVHLDVDSFAIQVQAKYEGRNTERDLELPVLSICAISCCTSKAKEYGVVRGPYEDNLLEIKKAHPDLRIIRTPQKFGKVDDLLFKKAGDDIYEAIVSCLKSIRKRFCLWEDEIPIIVEKPNCDEVFIDLTDMVSVVREHMEDHTCYELFSTFYDGKRNLILELPTKTVINGKMSFNQDGFHLKGLIVGASIINEVLDYVKCKTEYVITAGVARNKLQAKMACNLGKSKCKGNALCVLPSMSWERIITEIPLTKIPGLGGSIGNKIKDNLCIEFISELCYTEFWKLVGVLDGDRHFAEIIKQKCLGFDEEPVLSKYLLNRVKCGKSINTCRKNRIWTKEEFLKDLHDRFHEMRDKLVYEHDRHNRVPTHLRLEIKVADQNNAAGRTNIFDETYQLNFCEIKKLIQNWKEKTTYELQDWKPILGWFKNEINYNNFSQRFYWGNGGMIPYLRRIDFSAYFLVF